MRIRFHEVWELTVFPVVIATVNDDTAERNGVTVDVLCGGMNDNVCAEFQRFHEKWRCERVINEEGNVKFLGELGELFKI